MYIPPAPFFRVFILFLTIPIRVENHFSHTRNPDENSGFFFCPNPIP